jgi:hypothetical protein
MINVVGAGQDTDATPPVAYTVFTPPAGEKAPEPIAPEPIPEAPISEPTPSPEVEQPNNKSPHAKKRLTLILSGILLVLVLIGIGVALYLTQINQDLRQQASGALPEVTKPPITRPTDEPKPTTAPIERASVPEPTATIAPLEVAFIPPTDAPTQAPTAEPTTVQTTASCNESCLIDTNCINPAHVCHEGKCRLSSNLEDTTCSLPSGGDQVAAEDTATNRVYSSVATPSGTSPVSGPINWGTYLKVGLGALGLGTILLLLL